LQSWLQNLTLLWRSSEPLLLTPCLKKPNHSSTHINLKKAV